MKTAILAFVLLPALLHGRILTIQQHNAGHSATEAKLSRQTNIDATVANEKAENAFVMEIIRMQSQIAQLSGEFVRHMCLWVGQQSCFNFTSLYSFEATDQSGGELQALPGRAERHASAVGGDDRRVRHRREELSGSADRVQEHKGVLAGDRQMAAVSHLICR